MSTVPASADFLKKIRSYLFAKGWMRVDHPNQHLVVMETRPDESGDYGSVALPSSIELRDAGEVLGEAVRLIADFENARVDEVFQCISRWDRDTLRVRLFKTHGTEGDTLPLQVAAETLTGLREFVGYAAYTHTNPKPFFDRAGAVSSEFANHCEFGHTFRGSFGLSVECPVRIVPVLPMDNNPAIVPLERQVIERIASGFSTLEKSVKLQTPEPLLEGYRAGFNANMCRKLAEIYEAADGRRIEYNIAWSPQLTSPWETKLTPLVFEGRAYDFTKIAASELEKVEVYPVSVVEGRIVILRSEMPPNAEEQIEFERTITMFWEREKGQEVRIHVPLSPEEYMRACDAHKAGRSIRVYGIPEKNGKFWNLTKVHNFTVL